MALVDEINETLRDFVGWNSSNPLPIGDPRTGVHNLSKADLRSLLITIAQTMGDEAALQEILQGLDDRVPSLDIPSSLPIPIAAVGGDAVIVYRNGIDFTPSPDLQQRIAPALTSADTGEVIPLHAIGGDAVLVHRPTGLDFQPSDELRASLMGGASAAVPAVTGAETLRRMRAKIAALRRSTSGAVLRVLLVGDSWVMLNQLRGGLHDVLTAEFSLIGEGWLSANPVYTSLTGATYTATAGWTVIDGTAGGRDYGETPDGQMIHTDQGGQSLTWANMRCTRFSIYCREQGGSWRYRVDGGAWVTVTDATGGAFKRTQITGLSDTNHTIEIESVSGRVAIAGYFMARAGVSGIEISRFGDGGARADILQQYLPAQAAVLADEPPDLIITVLGTNDARVSEAQGAPSIYVGYMVDLLAAARAARPDVSAIHVIPPQNNLSVVRPTTAYRDAIRAAGLGTAYLSLTEHYDDYPKAAALGLWADDVHPSDTAGRMIADLLNDNLIRI